MGIGKIIRFFIHNKKTLGIYLLNISIFLLSSLFYFKLLLFNVQTLRLNPGLIAFFILTVQVIFLSILNKKYLQTKKQIFAVNILLFFTFIIPIIITFIPLIIKRQDCAYIIRTNTEEADQCMTFIENSRVAVIYVAAAFYLFLYTVDATLLQLTLFANKNKSRLRFLSISLIAVSGLVLILPFLIMQAYQNRIEIKQFPKDIPQKISPSTLYNFKLNNRQIIDPNIYQIMQPTPNIYQPKN